MNYLLEGNTHNIIGNQYGRKILLIHKYPFMHGVPLVSSVTFDKPYFCLMEGRRKEEAVFSYSQLLRGRANLISHVHDTPQAKSLPHQPSIHSHGLWEGRKEGRKLCKVKQPWCKLLVAPMLRCALHAYGSNFNLGYKWFKAIGLKKDLLKTGVLMQIRSTGSEGPIISFSIKRHMLKFRDSGTPSILVACSFGLTYSYQTRPDIL